MKKLLAAAVAALFALPLAGCGTPAASAATAETAGQPVELVVFAAASLTETLTEIADTYEAAHPGVTLTFNFDSSGTLKTQVEEGAACDVFLSAAEKQLDQLEDLGLVDTATRLDLLENRVTLCVPEGNPASIQGFDDLAGRLAAGDVLLAMGNSDVPVGQYTQKIFAHYGLDEGALASAGVLTYGTNVKEVTAQVAQGSVDCGIVYATDAYSAGLTVVDTATAELCGQVLYPGAVLAGSAHPAEAAAFLDYLSTPEAMKIFASLGFSAP